MEQVDVLAVVGICAPERLYYAKRLAAATERPLIPSRRLTQAADPIDEAVSLAQWADRRNGTVIEFPGTARMTELIGALAAPDAPTRLTGVACVADAAHLLHDLRRDDYAHRPAAEGRHPSTGMHIARALLTVNQLEYASVISLVNWSALSTDELSTVMALVSHLSPHARLRLDREPTGGGEPAVPYGIGQERPGWVSVLNGDPAAHMTDPRVSAFRYENVRPLHPGRLMHLLDERIEPGEFGSVIRSGGFCRFATRPQIVAQWDHVGRMISFEPLGRDDDLSDDSDLLALGQELAFIGLDLDAGALSAALDEVALTDEELTAGAALWARFPDPFPAWRSPADRTE